LGGSIKEEVIKVLNSLDEHHFSNMSTTIHYFGMADGLIDVEINLTIRGYHNPFKNYETYDITPRNKELDSPKKMLK